jgi:hypothetical protein
MTSVSAKLKIYPDYCHTLSPTIGKWCPLRATDIFALMDVGMFCDGMCAAFHLSLLHNNRVSSRLAPRCGGMKADFILICAGKPLYHHGNHPVKWVRLTGVIVAADEYFGRRVYTVDDSSGTCIECSAVAPPDAKSAISIPIPKHLDQLATLGRVSGSVPNVNSKAMAISTTTTTKEAKGAGKTTPSVKEPQVPWADMDVGVVVKVKGKVGEFRTIKQIEIIKVEVMKGLDAEVKCWNEVIAFRRDILGNPWVVSEEDEGRCRRAREKEMKRAKRGVKDGKEKEEAKRKRNQKERAEKVAKGQGGDEEKARKKREREAQMLPPPPRRKTNYPSLAVMQAAAGKYDALGI